MMAISFVPTPQGFESRATHGSQPIRRRKTLQDPVNCRLAGYPFRSAYNGATAVDEPVSTIQNRPSFSTESYSSCEDVTSKPVPKPRFRYNRIRSSSEGSSTASASRSVLVPGTVHHLPDASPLYPSSATHVSISSPLIVDLHTAPPPYSKDPEPTTEIRLIPMHSDTEEDHDEDDILYTSSRTPSGARIASSSSQSLRSRIFALASPSSPRPRHKTICTTPGTLCAGETETETDEPSRHLPTARIVPSSGPIVPPSTFAERVTPLLFEFSRLLSIVPAIFGTMYNVYYILYPPTASNTRPPPERIDYFLSALWAILTGFQCLRLATGLLTRWRLYYDPLSTLVRLLALQGICWPATHLTLSILEHEKRPVICWAIIGTTTCMSRSVQIWVTSNLWWEKREGGAKPEPGAGVERITSPLSSPPSLASVTGHVVSAETAQERRRAYWKRWGGGGKWGGRRWDWKEVSVNCVLPAGILYFVMAWAELLRREFSSPAC